LEYSCDLFEADWAEGLLAHYQQLLAAMVATPERRLSQLAMLSDVERYRQIVLWNDSGEAALENPARHQEPTIVALFEQQVERRPEAVALTLIADGQSGRQLSSHLTYDELERRANRLARLLVQRDIGPESRVGIGTGRNLSMVIAILGVLKAGAAYVPVDPDYPKARIAYVMSDAQVQILLLECAQQAVFADLEVECLALDDAEIKKQLASQSEAPLAAPAQGRHPDQAAYLMYTSGSTGQPKGVVCCHRSIVNRVQWLARLGIEPGEVFCQKTSIGFVDHVAELFQGLVNGVPLVMV
ncbi:AMP-binding protein, partial [Microbulbifer sp. TYP-18]|uniref:AMP-binding protein n=1 Tax=Microbulbifer sp. TYP-18 TaxID=3230024 RepID=UPI0034C5E5A5